MSKQTDTAWPSLGGIPCARTAAPPVGLTAAARAAAINEVYARLGEALNRERDRLALSQRLLAGVKR